VKSTRVRRIVCDVGSETDGVFSAVTKAIYLPTPTVVDSLMIIRPKQLKHHHVKSPHTCK
jgi:hypothetical protein